MKRKNLIFVVVFMVCSFIGGRLFAGYYYLEGPTYRVADVIDSGFSVTVTSGTTKLDCSIGGIGPDDTDNNYSNDAILESATGLTILEPGFYHINYDGTIENPTFVFSDTEISSTTIRFKLNTGSNPDWTQYAIAFSTAVNPSNLFTGTTYYIKGNGNTADFFTESTDWKPASFFEGVELTGLRPNTIYGFKIRSRIPPPELVFTGWSGDTDNYFWTHIETPVISSVTLYITSATVTVEDSFSNLGEGLSGINYRIKDRSWEGWTTATSYAFTGLDDNTPYIFEVKARNGQTPTPYETGVVSTGDEYTLCYPPTKPEILDVSVSSYSLTLVWSISPSAPKYYLIEEDGEFIDDNGDAIPDQYTGLSLDRNSLTKVNYRYTYQIYAVNQADEYDEISSVSISTYTFCSIPPAPQTGDVSENTIEIGINEGDNPPSTEYSIKVSGGGSVNYVQDGGTVGVSEAFNTNADWGDLTISNLLSNVEYDISVQAMNMYGHLTGYGASISSCTYASVPGLTVEELTNSVRITIEEGNNSPETEYEIYEAANDGSGWQGRGYLQSDGSTDLVNRVWQTKADWEAGGGFIVPDLDLLNYGYRFRAQARRTITGYSKKETGYSSYVYAGKVVNTPIATIGLEPLEAGTTKYYNTNQTVTFAASGADDLRYTYTINGSDPTEPTQSQHDGGPPPVTYDLTASAGESNTYRMRAKAWKGTGPEALASEVGGVWIAVIDRDPPTIGSFSIFEGTYTTHRNITLEISATGADEMYISGDVVDGGKWINYGASSKVLLTDKVGEKEVNLRVRDRAGNVTPPLSDDPESRSITLDPNPPTLDSVTINAGDPYTSSVNIDLSIVATNADYMYIDGDVIEEEGVTGDWIGFSSSKQVILTSGDEKKTVKVKIANTLWSEDGPKSDSITLDTKEPQNPTFTLSDPESGSQDYTNNGIVNVTINTSTLDPDVKWYILSKDYPIQPHRDDFAWTSELQSKFNLSDSDDGPQTVFLWVKDGAEHINVGVSSATITLDTKPPADPTLVLSDQATGSTDYTSSPTVNVAVANDSDAVAWLISETQNTQPQEDDLAWGSEPATFTLSMEEVPKTVYIWVKDAAGNINTNPVSATITLETTPPEIQGDIGARYVKHDNEELQEGIETGCKTPTFVWTATDNASGVAGYRYSFSTDIGAEPDIDITTNSILLDLTSDSDGIYYFKVKAKDGAGNFSEVKSFAYNYKADGVSPEVVSIDIEGKKRIEDEVKGVERSNTLPEISFTEEVWGVEKYVEVKVIRDNEGEEKNTKVNCTVTYESGLWKVDPGKDWQGNYTYKVKAPDEIEDKNGNALKEEKELVFTTMLDHTKRNVIMWESDPKTKMILEANALKEDGYVLINLEPLPLEKGGAIEAKEVNPKAIIEADEKMKRNADKYCYNLRESMKEISGYTTEGGEMGIKKFLNTVYVELPYGDENNNGIVDSTEGSSEPVSEKTLSVYWLDEDLKLWVKVAGTEVDKKEKVARAKVIGFGVYTLMGGGFYDLSDAHAYPVPYKPNDGLSITGDETSGITFTNLSTEAEIKIYTITGELVKKLVHKNGWYEEWYPVENEKGEKVVSGVYIYYIENIKQHKSGKLVIIR